MEILTQDRVAGLSVSKSPLSTYGPGNMLDNSNRNSWVSGDTEDSLIINCNSQVNGLFLGRYQADDIFLTFLGRELRSQVVGGGMSFGYRLDVLKAVSQPVIGGQGYVVTLTVDSSKKANVNDIIEVTGIVSTGKDSNRNLPAGQPTSSYPARNDPGNSSACGFHRITKVHTLTSETEIKPNGQTSISSITDPDLSIKQSISFEVLTNPGTFEIGVSDTTPAVIGGNWEPNQTNVACTIDETSGSGTNATFTVTTDSNGTPTFTITGFGSGYEEGDSIKITDPGITDSHCILRVTMSGTVQNGINAFHLSGGPSGAFAVEISNIEKKIYEYTVTVSEPGMFGSTNLTQADSPNPFVVGQRFSLSGLNSSNLGGGFLDGTHVITATNSADKTFKFRSYHKEAPVLSAGTALISFGSSVNFDGGSLLHNLGKIENSVTLFNSNEAVRFKDCSITNANINAIGSDSFLTYTDELGGPVLESTLKQNFTRSTVKDLYIFSFITPFFQATTSNSGTTITDGKLQRYVLDVADTLLTPEGVGTPIHRTRITTRTQTSLANFVTGDVVLVKSAFLPLPRQAFPSEVQIDFASTLNRNSSNMFNEWMLEEVETEGSQIQVDAMRYNPNDDGKLIIKMNSSSHGLAVNDIIQLTMPTDLLYGTDFQIANFTADGTQNIVTNVNNSGVYSGMTATGTGIPANTTVFSVSDDNQTVTLTNTVSASAPQGLTVTFGHASDAKTHSDIAFNRIHRIVNVNSDLITVYAPNFGASVDLTRSIETTFNTGSGTNTNQAVYSSAVTGRFIQKVTKGSGRFVRPITGEVNTELRSISTLMWNSGSTTVTYTVNSTQYEVPAGTATAIFASSHGLVNNDKIILFGLKNHTEGQHVVNLENSYLVTYGASNVISFQIPKASQKTATSQVAANGSTTMTITTSTDHGFKVTDSIDLYNSSTTTYNGTYIIQSVPTAKSFTITLASAVGSSVNLTGQTALVTSGVHLRNGSTYRTSGDSSSATDHLTDVRAVRTVSVEEAESAFEKPLAVGNVITIDGFEESSGYYNSGTVLKTPFISDSTRSLGYDSGSITSRQASFIGDQYSVKGQISKIIGDGTDKSNINLVQALGKLNEPLEFTSLRHAILTGILRVGVSETFPNPQTGLSNSFRDYSVRKELATGSYYFLNRESAKQFSGRIVGSPEEIDKFVDFGQDQLAEPFAVLVASGTLGEMKKLRIRAAIYGYFTALPTATYANKLATLKNANFTIKEVL